MTLTGTNKFKNKLDDILAELNQHHRDKEQLKYLYIQSRLTKSLGVYYHELMKAFEYLDYRDEDNLLKKYVKVIK